jgi:hypothetical protein
MNTRHLSTGQTLVEYAIIVPIFLLILLMLVDMGQIVFYYSSMQNAAREGARYGIIPHETGGSLWLDLAGAQAVTIDRGIGLNLAPGNVQVITLNRDADPQVEQVRVIVTFSFNPASPFFGLLTLTARSTMWIEW